MQAPMTGAVRLATRLLIAAVAALAAVFAFQASSALGAPQTQVYIGDQPATPDIRLGGVQYIRPNGVPATTGSAGTLNFLLDGQHVVAYCLQVNNPVNTGTVTSDVVPIDAPDADQRAIRWIVFNQAPTGPVTPEKQTQAGVAQVAIWVLRNQLRAVNPTNNAAINSAVDALLATARAESAAQNSLTLAGTPGVPGDQLAGIDVSARPGAVVSLAITSGPGTLSSNTVTIGPSGTARVNVAGPGNGTTVSATTSGGGTLRELDPIDGSQNSMIAGASQITATLTVRETPVVVATQIVTTVASPRANQVRGSLRLTKTAPTRARTGAQVRYTITVRNSSEITVRNVRLLDRIPGGMSFVSATDGGTLTPSGRVRWQLGTLRAGQSRTVNVVLQASAAVRGNRTNLATVSATNTRTVRARVTTLFQAVRRPVRVPVTG